MESKVIRLTEAEVAGVLTPRPRDSHKGTYGYICLLGGCAMYSGAAKLANLAAGAMRAGCGVVRLAVPRGIAAAVMPYLLESTLFPMPDDGAGIPVYDATALDGALAGVRAAGIGMGWGENGDYRKILCRAMEKSGLSLVIDAGGLNALSKDITPLRSAAARVILTPHPKEFSRLSGIPVDEVTAAPAVVAAGFAAENRCVVLLKGAVTTVSDGTVTYQIDRGGAGMATAGSGDVLTGILTGMLGYLPPSAKTVACAAYLAGVAGEIAERKMTDIAMVASDTVASLPDAVRSIRNAQ